MISGYPIWAVAVICIGVFVAGMIDAIGAGFLMKKGARIVTPVILIVLSVFILKVILEIFGISF